MKIRSAGTDLFHGKTQRQTDRQTDITKPVVAFCNFAKAPKQPAVCNLFIPSL